MTSRPSDNGNPVSDAVPATASEALGASHNKAASLAFLLAYTDAKIAVAKFFEWLEPERQRS